MKRDAIIFSAFLALSSIIGAPRTVLAQADAAPQCYSLPWQLRPAAIGNVARVESGVAAFNDANGNLDLALATVFEASYRTAPEWAPLLRLGFVGNNAPGAARDGGAFVNPLVGVTYARRLGGYELAFFGATTLPVGMGGGNAANPSAAKAGVAARSARPTDDAMFAVDYMTPMFGADLAYTSHGFTAQLELSLLQLIRVRGEQNAAATDALRTSAVMGLHLGYFIGRHFSLGTDVRYQRWLSHPTHLHPASGQRVPIPDARMDVLTVAIGPRFHFELGMRGGIHPGIAFVRGFDARGFEGPFINDQTTAIQVDVPVQF
jgi:hypothetical protein